MTDLIIFLCLCGLAATIAWVAIQPRHYLLRHFRDDRKAAWEWEQEIVRRTAAIIRERGVPLKSDWCSFCETSHPAKDSARTLAEREYYEQMNEASQ